MAAPLDKKVVVGVPIVSLAVKVRVITSPTLASKLLFALLEAMLTGVSAGILASIARVLEVTVV